MVSEEWEGSGILDRLWSGLRTGRKPSLGLSVTQVLLKLEGIYSIHYPALVSSPFAYHGIPRLRSESFHKNSNIEFFAGEPWPHPNCFENSCTCTRDSFHGPIRM